MNLLRKGGTCVATGITPYSEPLVPLILQEMVLSAKQLKGVLYGGMNPRTSVTKLLSMYQAAMVGEYQCDGQRAHAVQCWNARPA